MIADLTSESSEYPPVAFGSSPRTASRRVNKPCCHCEEPVATVQEATRVICWRCTLAGLQFPRHTQDELPLSTPSHS